VLGQPWAGHAARGTRNVFGRARREDEAAVRAAAWPHVDEVVGGGEQVQVVVDDDNGGAGVQQPVEHAGQGGYVKWVQAGGWPLGAVQSARDAGYPGTPLGMLIGGPVGTRNVRRIEFTTPAGNWPKAGLGTKMYRLWQVVAYIPPE
jgi:hypothetical protein